MMIIKKYVFVNVDEVYQAFLSAENLRIMIWDKNKLYLKYNTTFSLNDVITRQYRMLDAGIDITIFKDIANLLKNSKLSVFEQKCRDFWQALDLDKIQTLSVDLGNNKIFKITNFNVEVLNNLKKYSFFEHAQNFCYFFFYGPEASELPFDVRLKAKKNIFDAIDKSAINLKFSDGFVLFDYENIKPTEFVREYFSVTDRLSIGQGFVRVETNLDTDDFDIETFSVETLWYAPDYVIPRVFEDKKDEILKVLENAIVKPAHSQEPKDNIDRDTHEN